MQDPRRLIAALPLMLAAACAPAGDAAPRAEGEPLRVVASTSIVGDVVANVGGDAIDLTVLMAPGQDPHSYEPAARDLAIVEGADLVFLNGLGLEEGLEETIDAAAGSVPVVAVSGDGDASDPHTWMDPRNVIDWSATIAEQLAASDPSHADAYRANADAYAQQLEALDAYIQEQVDRIPPGKRRLVTNHDALGYFARRYDFEIVGTVYIGPTQLNEPSAGELGQLIQTIRDENARAIFVETTVSDELAKVVADELGYEVGIYSLYTGSLGPPGSGAETYLSMMRANADTIVGALLDD